MTASPDTANPAGPTEAILALFENQYGKKVDTTPALFPVVHNFRQHTSSPSLTYHAARCQYPLSPAFLAPTANPAYYQTVAAKVEQVLAARSELEASGYSLRARLRLWFAIFWGRMRRKVRWR